MKKILSSVLSALLIFSPLNAFEVESPADSIGATELNSDSASLIKVSGGAASSDGTDVTIETGVILAPSGSAGAPPYSFTGDANSGFYRSSADVIVAATGGSARVIFEDEGLRINVTGSAATPSIRINDLDTGLFLAAANQIGIATAGSERLRIGSNGLVGINDTSPDSMLDVIVNNASSSGTVITAAASQTADLLDVRDSSESSLFVITENGDVGIGNASPTAPQFGTPFIGMEATAERPALSLARTDAGATDQLGVITFARTPSDSLAAIIVSADGATDAGRFTWFTQPTGGAITERMRISSDGSVGIGVTGDTGGLEMGDSFAFFSRTQAQIEAITPTQAGEAYYCSDCTATAVCISTGTAVDAFGTIQDGTADCT